MKIEPYINIIRKVCPDFFPELDEIEKLFKEQEETIKNLQCCGNCYYDPAINNIGCKHHGACRSFFWTKDESLTDYWQDKSS